MGEYEAEGTPPPNMVGGFKLFFSHVNQLFCHLIQLVLFSPHSSGPSCEFIQLSPFCHCTELVLFVMVLVPFSHLISAVIPLSSLIIPLSSLCHPYVNDIVIPAWRKLWGCFTYQDLTRLACADFKISE